MKQYTWILLTSLFIFPLASNSQELEPLKKTKAPEITKGYYSIGDHSMKIPARTWIAADTYSTPSVNKGYYAIGDNKQKLPRRISWFPKPGPKPEITKGYYSIGDHWKRLNK